MADTRTWYLIRLTDGTEQHALAHHIGFNPSGPAGAEVVFYADGDESQVEMTVPVNVVDRIDTGEPDAKDLDES